MERSNEDVPDHKKYWSEVQQDQIAQQLDMSILRYSRVWEDHRILCQGLDINHDDVILSVTSSGDNVLNMLLKEPKQIVSVDISEAQNSLLELKLTAIKCLDDYNEFLQLLGEIPSDKRLSIFEKIQPHLPVYAKEFWMNNLPIVEAGISWSGRLEKYILNLRLHLPDSLNPDLVDRFFSSSSLEEQKKCIDEMPLDELGARISWYFSKDNLEQGRSQVQQKYVDISSDGFGKMIWERFLSVCRNIPVADNFYLSLWFRGDRGYDPVDKPDYIAPYLTKEGFQKLKGLVNRVSVRTISVEDAVISPDIPKFTKACLSNIFEYFSAKAAKVIFDLLGSSMASGSRIAYWELFTSRKPSPDGKLHYLKDLSERLAQIDRVFWYDAFRVYEVK